ncbi:hypothetical protein CAPTEDRAFT_89333, partial [Capitella teleta]
KCNSKQAIGQAADLWYNESVDAMIGPPCSIACRSVAEITSFFKIPHISWVASDPDLNDKEIYSTLSRTLGPFSKMGEFILEVMAQYNWKRVVTLSSNYLLYMDASKAIRMVFNDNNITIAYQSSYDRFPPEEYITKALLKTQQEGRIVFLVCPMEDRRRFMLKARDLGMTNGEYVYYTIDMLPDEDNLDPEAIWRGNDGRDADAREAFKSVSLAALSGRQVNTFRQEVGRRMRNPPYSFSSAENVSVILYKYSPFLYDAVMMYGLALNETLNKGLDDSDGMNVVRNLRQKAFSGMTGSVVLDDGGDREPDYWITDMNPFTGYFVKIAEVLNKDLGVRVSGGRAKWPTGEVGHEFAPPDTPVCGFMNEFLSGWIIIMTSIFSGIFLTSAILLSLYLYRKNKFETELLIQSWRISKDDIDMVNTRGGGVKMQSASHLKSMVSFGTTQQQFFSDCGYYRGQMVALKKIKKEHMQLSRAVLTEFKEIKDIIHDNLITFIGAVFDPPNIELVSRYCHKGSLQDIIMNDEVKLDPSFKQSFVMDIIKGMDYLHKSHLHSHGNLKSSNCLVDARWTVKITDYGLPSFLAGQQFAEDDYGIYRRKLWTAPEILRENFPPARGTQKGDVYSFAIVMFEIVTRSEPYNFDSMTPRDAVNRVRNGESIPFRPSLPSSCDCGVKYLALVQSCWEEKPESRPNFGQIKSTARKMIGKDISILDNILGMMEKYAYNLEEIVEERTQELVEEKKKTDRLLYKMLPSSVADQLKAGKAVTPENYENSSIYFSDIVGFTTISCDSNPMQIVDFLNDLYTCFDDIISKHDVYKVETIGDAYMVVSGVPVINGSRHFAEIANVSLDLLSTVTKFRIRHRPNQQLQLRIGLHSGPCVAGVVGLMMPRYCLFGDTVNKASTLEATGKPLRIHISEECYRGLVDIGGYEITPRGEINIKGKGFIKTFWLHGRKGFKKELPSFE